MIIAIIGSRRTPQRWNRFIYGLTSILLKSHEIRSGMCQSGPDYAVTMAVTLAKETDDIFNVKLFPANKEFVLTEYQHFACESMYEERKKIVEELHPAPQHLTEYSYTRHMRNLNIIGDVKLDNFVDLVIYACPGKNVSGGTKMGVEYAQSRGIRTFNVMNEPLEELFKLIGDI